MRSVSAGLVGVLAVIGVVDAVGCGGSAPAPVPPGKAARVDPCARRSAGGARRTEDTRQGNAVVLATDDDRTLAYVADADSRAIHVIDVDHRKEIATTPLSGAPAQLLILEDGRVAATLGDRGVVVVLEPGAEPEDRFTSLCEVPVGAEPFGLAATPDDERVVVTSGWAATLTVLAARSMTPLFTTALPREPRSVVVDDDGARAFVTHVVGTRLSVVDLTPGGGVRSIGLETTRMAPNSPEEAIKRRRETSQGYALAMVQLSTKQPFGESSRILAPMVTVDPGDPETSTVYYGPPPDFVAKETPAVFVIDPASERSLTTHTVGFGGELRSECVLPRASSVRASTSSLFVGCFGTDEVVELDARGVDPAWTEIRRFSVPSGPRGLAVDDEHGRLVVFSQFEGLVSIVDLDRSSDEAAREDEGALALVKVSYEPGVQALVARGRQLFHRSDDASISDDGVACASCHPDGRDDAITWSTPEGPRQTLMLAGRVRNSAPYGWTRNESDLPSYIASTVSRLGGGGLEPQDLDALVAYLETLHPPSSLVAAEPAGVARAGFARGRELFYDARQGCASCHVGATGADKATHSFQALRGEVSPVYVDTPSLIGVAGTAPYFHDGRYATLEALLADELSTMGHTATLPADDRAALEAFLRTL